MPPRGNFDKAIRDALNLIPALSRDSNDDTGTWWMLDQAARNKKLPPPMTPEEIDQLRKEQALKQRMTGT